MAGCQLHMFFWLEEGSRTGCRLVAVVSSLLSVDCLSYAVDCIRHQLVLDSWELEDAQDGSRAEIVDLAYLVGLGYVKAGSGDVIGSRLHCADAILSLGWRELGPGCCVGGPSGVGRRRGAGGVCDGEGFSAWFVARLSVIVGGRDDYLVEARPLSLWFALSLSLAIIVRSSVILLLSLITNT